MAIYEVASLALERLLPRAYRHVGVTGHAHHVCLVHHQPSHRSVGRFEAEHTALPCGRRCPRMTMMIASCKEPSSLWLLLTWLISMRSASIMPVNLAHDHGLQIMRKLAQSIPSICTAAAVTTWTVHFGARSCSLCENACSVCHQT